MELLNSIVHVLLVMGIAVDYKKFSAIGLSTDLLTSTLMDV